MRKTAGLLLLLFVIVGVEFGQTQIVTTQDGRKVILKPNRTWEYVGAEDPKTKPSEKIEIPAVSANYEEVQSFYNANKEAIGKSEFETSEQYYSRLQKFLDNNKFKDKPAGEITFILSPNLEYNAESQEFDVRIPMLMEYGSPYRHIQMYWKVGKDFFIDNLAYRIKMTAEKAREAKVNIQMAIIGFPIRSQSIELDFVPLKIVIFNKETREVYFKEIRNLVSD